MLRKYKVTFKYEKIVNGDYDNPVEEDYVCVVDGHDIGEAFNKIMNDEYFSEVSEPYITSIVEGGI